MNTVLSNFSSACRRGEDSFHKKHPFDYPFLSKWTSKIVLILLLITAAFWLTPSPVSAKWRLFRSTSTTVSHTSRVVACGCYAWQGQTYTVSGYYTVHLTGSNGIDSLVALDLSVNQPTSSSISQTACDSYTWLGTTYTTSGNYTSSFINSMGCDSIVTLNLTIVPTTTTNSQVTACGSYIWPENGMTYTGSGVYSTTVGCEQRVLDLTIIPTTTTTTTAAACSTYTWAANGQVYTASGTYSYQSGCTTQLLQLTIDPLPAAPVASITQPSCTTSTGSLTITSPTGTGFQYSINSGPWQSGTNFSGLTSGTYSITAKNANGCISAASIVTIDPQPATPGAPVLAVTQPSCTTNTGVITITSPVGTGLTYSTAPRIKRAQYSQELCPEPILCGLEILLVALLLQPQL
jgi:hypothetical protein